MLGLIRPPMDGRCMICRVFLDRLLQDGNMSVWWMHAVTAATSVTERRSLPQRHGLHFLVAPAPEKRTIPLQDRLGQPNLQMTSYGYLLQLNS
jgi:hypothetical protein